MNHRDLEYFRNRFLTMLIDFQRYEELEAQLSIKQSGDEMDLLQANQDNVLILNLKGRDQRFLTKIHHALDKIDAGVFGECEECGDEISMDRLKARPTAQLCILCKEELERVESHISSDRPKNGVKVPILVSKNVFKLSFGEEEKENTSSNVIPFL
ncbi:MAG: TraR/DksA family transcriptional regulator [Halobacteriovoraceae bacterium]|nr:TraR/DksA family transcriptional regulator [Halobacteriovoraceae bacterium]